MYRSSIMNLSVQRDFYQLEIPGIDSQLIENLLSAVESDVATPLSKIVQGSWPIEPVGRSALALFAATLFLRTADQRSVLTQLDTIFDEMPFPSGSNTNKIWIDPRLKVVETSEAKRIHNMTIPSNSREIAELLEHRVWTLVEANSTGFISSDSPVSLVRTANSLDWQGIGISNADAVILPVSRQFTLIMGLVPIEIQSEVGPEIVHGHHDRKIIGTLQSSEWLNAQCFANAREIVYCHPDDFGELEKIVEVN